MAKNIVKSITIIFFAENSLENLEKIRAIVCNILVIAIIFKSVNFPLDL